MSNKILITSIWAASVALAYWLGLEGGSEFPASNEKSKGGGEIASGPLSTVKNTPKSPSPTGLNASTIGSRQEEVSKALASSLVTVDERLEVESKQKSLLKRLRSGNPVERLAAFTEVLNDPTSANLSSAIDAYKALPEGHTRFSELRLLTYAWSQVDPAGALEWVGQLERFEKHIGSSSVLDAWSRNDPNAAIEWAKSNYEGDDNPYFPGIISGMAEKDFAGATQLMESMPYGRNRGRAASMMLEKVWNKGEDAAVNWANELESDSLKEFAVGRLAEKIAREDLDRAAGWAGRMEEGEIKRRAVESVADHWAEKDPVAAAEWVDGLPKVASRSEGMQDVVREWARKDPAATAEWLNKYPAGVEMDKPVEAFVRSVAQTDPQNALTWAESISDEKRREEVVKDVNRVIERQQAAAAAGEAPRSDNRGRGGRGGPSFGSPR
ncbi:MAG: hypothetical protein H8E24_07720 [Verrucomicrobia bacterium]|nr:hypothetical protein [Verrucomicrobiota bacterium]